MLFLKAAHDPYSMQTLTRTTNHFNSQQQGTWPPAALAQPRLKVPVPWSFGPTCGSPLPFQVVGGAHPTRWPVACGGRCPPYKIAGRMWWAVLTLQDRRSHVVDGAHPARWPVAGGGRCSPCKIAGRMWWAVPTLQDGRSQVVGGVHPTRWPVACRVGTAHHLIGRKSVG